MKQALYLWLTAAILLISTSIMAREYNNYHENSYNSNSMGDTHYVRPYTKEDGTFVEGHQSGNPDSGVHCEDNVCY